MVRKKIVILDEDVSHGVESKIDCVNSILHEYSKNDICIEEMLYSIEVQGFSIQDVVDIFAKVINTIESDQLLQYKECETLPMDRSNW